MTYRIAYLDSSDGMQKERDSTPEETSARDIFVADSLSSSQAAEAIKAVSETKLTGIEILGVMCSATKEDQNGMIAIGFDKLTNTLAGTQMGSTTMEFENGSELVITDENFSEVDALWRPFRKSFF